MKFKLRERCELVSLGLERERDVRSVDEREDMKERGQRETREREQQETQSSESCPFRSSAPSPPVFFSSHVTRQNELAPTLTHRRPTFPPFLVVPTTAPVSQHDDDNTSHEPKPASQHPGVCHEATERCPHRCLFPSSGTLLPPSFRSSPDPGQSQIDFPRPPRSVCYPCVSHPQSALPCPITLSRHDLGPSPSGVLTASTKRCTSYAVFN